MSIEEVEEKLRTIVQVENAHPMLKYVGSPLFGGCGIDGGKKLYGSVQHRKFKIWENATRWNGGILLTYVIGVYGETDKGTRVLLRAGASRIQHFLLLACVGFYCYYVSLVLFGTPQSALGIAVLLSVGLLMLLAATIPFIAVHRFMAGKVIGYLEEELRMDMLKMTLRQTE